MSLGEALQEFNEELEGEAEELKEKLNKTKASLHSAESRNRVLQQQLAEASLRAERAEEDVERLQSTIEAMKIEHRKAAEIAAGELRNKAEELLNTQMELKRTEEKARRETTDAELKCEAAEQARRDMMAQLRTMEEEQQQCQEQHKREVVSFLCKEEESMQLNGQLRVELLHCRGKLTEMDSMRMSVDEHGTTTLLQEIADADCGGSLETHLQREMTTKAAGSEVYQNCLDSMDIMAQMTQVSQQSNKDEILRLQAELKCAQEAQQLAEQEAAKVHGELTVLEAELRGTEQAMQRQHDEATADAEAQAHVSRLAPQSPILDPSQATEESNLCAHIAVLEGQLEEMRKNWLQSERLRAKAVHQADRMKDKLKDASPEVCDNRALDDKDDDTDDGSFASPPLGGVGGYLLQSEAPGVQDALREYFSMTVLAVKLCEGGGPCPTEELHQAAMAEGIPMEHWHKWVMLSCPTMTLLTCG